MMNIKSGVILGSIMLLTTYSMGCKKDVGEICKKHDGCKAGLRCNSDTGRCQDFCQDICRSNGLCAFDPFGPDTLCRANSDSDCKQSDGCKKVGACIAGEGGFCHPRGKSDSECRANALCKEVGFCSHSNGICIAAGRNDCLQSQFCRRHGGCKHRIDRCGRGF